MNISEIKSLSKTLGYSIKATKKATIISEFLHAQKERVEYAGNN